ncbi:MAG: hypothetical protein BWY31_01555 [Lentisphaerae bacterium ADurb.Bin242]|nr:MAG: hypothetical protein BWY31_01555 [Lentisphaerae bacterium ADurb.Bin242]
MRKTSAKPETRFHRFPAFTLLELVVVSAGILCLAAVTAGTISAAAPDAKITACADIMRGIEKRMTTYENSTGGRLISGNNKGRLWGAQLVGSKLFDDAGFHNAQRTQPKQFECPAETRERREGKILLDHPSMNFSNSYDYAVNYFTHIKITADDQVTLKRAELKKPSELIRLLEGTRFAVINDGDGLSNRHGIGTGNVIFEDGHCEFLSAVPVKKSANYKHANWYN